MQLFLITFRSITYAQKGEAVLSRIGIPCRLRRTPAPLSRRGCGYALQLRAKDAPAAEEAFRLWKITFENQYLQREDGTWQEKMT